MIFKNRQGGIDTWEAVVLNEEHISVARIKSNGGAQPQLLAYDEVPIIGDKLATLKRLRSNKKIGRSRCTTLLIKGQYQFIQVDALKNSQNMEREELREALRWHVKDMVDIPVEQAGVDFLDILSSDNRTLHHWVVVASHDVLRPRIELFQEVKVPLTAIDITEVAHRNIAALFEEENRGLALVRLIDQVIAHYGRLDALVNNASSFFATPLGQIDEAAWDNLVGSNFKGPLFLSQAAAPHLRQQHGCIVNITDIHAERPLKNYPLYCAAKAGLLGLTRALALELAPQVRVNAVAPGSIKWPDHDRDFPPAEREAIVAHSLLKRIGAPSDIAAAVRYLIQQAPYVTGQVINVDGGRTAHL